MSLSWLNPSWRNADPFPDSEGGAVETGAGVEQATLLSPDTPKDILKSLWSNLTRPFCTQLLYLPKCEKNFGRWQYGLVL